MAANTAPIFTRLGDPQVGGAVIGPTANTNLDGTSSSTSSTLIYTSDATNGSYVQKVILKAVGSPAASVARVFLCTATGALTMGTTNTAANTSLIGEVAVPAITVSQTAASPQFEIPINIALGLDQKLLLAFGTSTGAAGTGYASTVVAGKY